MSDQVLQQSINGMEAELSTLRSLLPFDASLMVKIKQLKAIIIDMEMARVLIRYRPC